MKLILSDGLLSAEAPRVVGSRERRPIGEELWAKDCDCKTCPTQLRHRLESTI